MILMTYKGPKVPTCYPSFPTFRGATCRARPADAPRRNKGPKVPTCYPSFPAFRGATCRVRPADAPRRNHSGTAASCRAPPTRGPAMNCSSQMVEIMVPE
jgi:hypothetical protein